MSDDPQRPETPGSAAAHGPMPGDATGSPWPPPVNDSPASNGQVTWSSPSTPSVHDQQTVTSMPGTDSPSGSGQPPRPWANPFAPPNPTPPADQSANPFAPPPTPPQPQDGPVPPPPIGPDGPGQVPYGYPGGYGHPAGPSGYGGPPGNPHSYYGWPGVTPMPSNGMGTAALVLGIIAAALFCLWPLAIVLGVLAVIFGAIGRKKAHRGEATNPGQALAGLICGAVGIALGAGFGALVLATSL